MPKLFLHHIDVVNNQYISGWCLNRLLPQIAVTLRITVNGNAIGEVSCRSKREDVKKAGLHRSGHCGFVFPFPSEVFAQHDRIDFSIKGLPGTLFSYKTSEIEPVVQDASPVLFMHIPKTAGTSFNNHVQSWFGLDRWHIHTETYPEHDLKALAQPGYYLAGHLPFYKLNSLFPDISLLNLHSMLREPLSQFHSHLAWIKGIGLHPEGKFFRAHPEVVQSLALKLQTQDVRTADALATFVKQLDGFEWDFFDNIQSRYFVSKRPEQMGIEEYNDALNNLRHFSSIGLTEQYQAFLQSTAKQYQRRHRPQSSQHNKTKVKPLFDLNSAEIRDAVLPLIQFDQQLYDAVAASNRQPAPGE